MFHYEQWRDAAGGALHSVGRSGGNNSSHITKSLRDRLANYLSSEQGEISRQHDVLQVGAIPPDFEGSC